MQSVVNWRGVWLRGCIGCLTMFLCLAATLSASAQGPDGGPPTMEQAMQMNLRMLTMIRSNPQAKTQVLARMKERLAQRGVADAAARLGLLGKILDEAAAMSEAEFGKNQQQLASRIIAQMRGEGGGAPAGNAPASAAGSAPTRSQPAVATPRTSKMIPWIDVHDHLVADQQDFSGSIRAAVAVMDQAHIRRMICMPPPQSTAHFDCETFASGLRPYRNRFAFLGGGGSLNVMLQQAANQTSVSASVRREFERKAVEILRQGAAGFGEMTVHHLSLHGANHPYECVAADHALMFLLADIAAKHDVLIDLHLDLVTKDIPPPAWLTSPNNPKILPANLASFERLLDHNPKAKICWAHAGSDNIGHWTAELSRGMLQKHPNLYMSLRMGPGHAPENFPMTPEGQIKPEWLAVFQEFPNRFVIGDDQFIIPPNYHGPQLAVDSAHNVSLLRDRTLVFLSALPNDLARKFATENAVALYRLKD